MREDVMKSEKFLAVLRQNNQKRAHLFLTEDTMQQIREYHAQGYTKRDMCTLFGVGLHVMHRCFREMGLRGRAGAPNRLQSRQYQPENTALFRAQQLEPVLRQHMIVEGMTSVEVGRLCGLDYSTIIVYARLLGIPVQTRVQAASKPRGQLVVVGPLLEILDGELLGDGYIPKPHTHSALFGYMTPRQSYLQWLSTLLASHGLNGRIYGPKKMPSSQPSYQYASKWFPELFDLRQRWYPNGIKCVPRDIVLTPTVCRHWYLGDGSMHQPPQPPYIMLCTHGFIYEDVEFLASLIEPFAPGVRVGKPQSAGPPLYLPKKAALAFLDYIGPCPNGLREVYGYKWRLPRPAQLSLWKYGAPLSRLGACHVN